MVNPTSYLAGLNAGNQLQGMQAGLGAIALGQQAAAQKRQQAISDDAMALGRQALDAWKAKDRQGFANSLRQLSAIDPAAAESIRKNFAQLQWDNVVEAGYNVYAAAASPDVESQNKLLSNASDILQAGPDHWMKQGIKRMRGMPQGPERQGELAGSVQLLQNLGVFPGESRAAGKQTPKQKTGAFVVRDKNTGNVQIVTGSFDPTSGQLEVVGAPLPEGYEMVSDLGETAKEETQRRIKELGGKEQVKGAIKASQDFADQYMNVQKSITTIDNAIKTVSEGLASGENLGVGPIKQYLPKWNEASARLQNIANKMGLDVVSSVTFGALSAPELRMAMQTAMPSNLSGRELLQWLRDKKAAQEKLGKYVQEASLFIGSQKPDGTYNTVQDWMRKGRSLQGTQYSPTSSEAEATPEAATQQQMPRQTVAASQIQGTPTVASMAEGEQLGPGQLFIFNGILYEN